MAIAYPDCYRLADSNNCAQRHAQTAHFASAQKLIKLILIKLLLSVCYR